MTIVACVDMIDEVLEGFGFVVQEAFDVHLMCFLCDLSLELLRFPIGLLAVLRCQRSAQIETSARDLCTALTIVLLV